MTGVSHRCSLCNLYFQEGSKDSIAFYRFIKQHLLKSQWGWPWAGTKSPKGWVELLGWAALSYTLVLGWVFALYSWESQTGTCEKNVGVTTEGVGMGTGI